MGYVIMASYLQEDDPLYALQSRLPGEMPRQAILP